MLEGIKIIDFTRLLPGPLATHLLAQMGAEVIKIESPKRMDYVRMGVGMVEGSSTLFHQLNHNKTMEMVDYNSPDGKAEVMELIRNADALIEQFRPGAMDAWGLGYEEIKKINPNIVYVSVTGYGQEGELANEAGHDFNYLAYSGVMGLLKDENGKPTVPDTQIADISGAYMTVMALQSALLKKERTGEGSFVDVSLCNAMLPFLALPFSFQESGMDYRRFNIINGKTTVNYSPYECADGKWLSVAAMEMKFWNNICEIINKPEWKKDNQLELMNDNFPKNELELIFKSKGREEWLEIFKGKDVCIAPILEMEELENSDYHKGSGNFEEFTTKNGTSLKTIALPFKIR